MKFTIEYLNQEGGSKSEKNDTKTKEIKEGKIEDTNINIGDDSGKSISNQKLAGAVKDEIKPIKVKKKEEENKTLKEFLKDKKNENDYIFYTCKNDKTPCNFIKKEELSKYNSNPVEVIDSNNLTNYDKDILINLFNTLEKQDLKELNLDDTRMKKLQEIAIDIATFIDEKK